MLDLTVFFALLGSVHVKAAHKMLVKLTPDVNSMVSFTIISSWKAIIFASER